MAAVAWATAADAQILTAFDVSGSNTSTPTQVTDASVTATPLSRTTVVAVPTSNGFNSNTWNITNTVNTSTNYIAFSITAGTSSVMVSSLGYAINGSNTAPNTGMWAYTLDGGTSFTLQTSFTNVNAVPTARSLWDFPDFSLAASNTVQFRFFEYGTTAINSANAATAGGTTRIANVATANAPIYDLILNGPNAAVEPLNPAAAPEPSALAILATVIGLGGLIVYRRNQAA